MADNDIRTIELLVEASKYRLTRRQLIRKGLTMGLSTSAIGWVLAACGKSSSGGATSTSTSQATQAGAAATGTTSQATSQTTTQAGAATPAAPSSSATSQAASTPPSATPESASFPAATGTLKTGGTPQDGGDFTVILADTGITADLDPQSAYDVNTIFFGPYEMLIQLKGNSTFEYQPMLAKQWSHSSDWTEWTFILSDNVKFHDGTACDAPAVVKSFQRFVKMQRGPYDVIGRFVADPDTDITAPDATTIKFKIKTPNPIFEAAMASQYGPLVVSPAAVEKHKTAKDPFAHAWFAKNMVGTGPYKQVSASPDQIVLERFPDYHQGWQGAHFNRVIFRVVQDTSTRRTLLEGGSADALTNTLTPEAVSDLKKNQDIQVVEYPTTQVLWSWMNCGDRLKDPETRQGLSYAFPYDGVREGVYEGLVAKTGGPLTPTTRGYDQNVFIYETDLDKAKALLSKNLKPGTKLTMMIGSGSELTAAVAQLYQANLQQIGYGLEIRQVEGSAEVDLAYGDAPPSQRPDFFGDWSWWPDYNDGYNEIYPNFYSKAAGSAGSNMGFYKNRQVDKVLETLAKGVPNEGEYDQLLAQIQTIVTKDDPPVIYWGMGTWYSVFSGMIRGYVWNPVYLGSYNYYTMYRVK